MPYRIAGIDVHKKPHDGVPPPPDDENILFDSLVDSVTCRYFRKKVLVGVVAEVTEQGEWSYERMSSKAGVFSGSKPIRVKVRTL